MATNIRDIAKSAGVSVTTVSKVINNHPHVSATTKERVLQVIREKKFIPSHTARGLVKGRSKTLGLFLTTGLSHPFLSNVMVGLEDALSKTGYDLLYLARVDWNPDYSLLRHCMSRNVEGVLIFGFQKDDFNFDEMLNSDIPTLFIDMDLVGRRAGFITSDNSKSIEEAVRYLYELNHRKIAFISGQLDSYTGKLRFEGYRQAIQELGLPYTSEFIFMGDFTKESGYSAMKSFLQQDERPTAVVCSSDMSAIGAMDAAREAGLTVPDDLSIIGFDDIELSQHLHPALTTIRQDFLTIGTQAILQLNDMIHTPSLSPPALIIPTKLIIRNSCSICRAES